MIGRALLPMLDEVGPDADSLRRLLIARVLTLRERLALGLEENETAPLRDFSPEELGLA